MWHNPVLYPTFLARNRMVTSVLAKTTKVKNNFINGKKKFKRKLSCRFGGKRKVQVTNLPSRTSSVLSEGEKFKLRTRTSSRLSVLLQARSAQRLSSQHFAAVLTPDIGELVLFGFFLSTITVFGAVRTHFPRKNTSIFMSIGNLSRKNKKKVVN